MSILTVGSIPGGDEEIIRIRKSRSQLSGGARTLGFSHRSQIYAREHAPLRLRTCIPAGVIRSHGHRIDFCGSAALYQSCYLSIDAVRNNNWSFSYCSAQRRCLNSTIGKTLRSHTRIAVFCLCLMDAVEALRQLQERDITAKVVAASCSCGADT